MYTAKNNLVLNNILSSDYYILDIGCGTGANAREIKHNNVDCHITGVNQSMEELEAGKDCLDSIIEFDLNSNDSLKFDVKFDLIICSHVLEHLTKPSLRVVELSNHLKPAGRMILIVPNFAIWKARLRLLLGKFEYEEHGLYDSTHMRFYTWNSFPKEILPEGFVIVERLDSGHLPMPLLRRILPNYIVTKVDKFFLKLFPNLFSSEVGLIIQKKFYSTSGCPFTL